MLSSIDVMIVAFYATALFASALKLLVLTLPFIEGVWLVFVLCLVIAVFWSLEKPHPQFSHIEPSGVSL
jgi:Ca2+/Na+ antiporter|tara:strand:- start:405 stop:611 length:207 start_codon:yes stop_codon:yes gene_type:complete